MIRGLTFRVDVWVSAEELERYEDDQRSLPKFLKDEIQSNLESLHGVFDVAVKQEPSARKGQ